MTRKNPTCSICGLSFPSTKALFAHRKEIHGKTIGRWTKTGKRGPTTRHTRVTTNDETPVERMLRLQTEVRQTIEDLRTELDQKRRDVGELETMVEQYEALLMVNTQVPSNYGALPKA